MLKLYKKTALWTFTSFTCFIVPWIAGMQVTHNEEWNNLSKKQQISNATAIHFLHLFHCQMDYRQASDLVTPELQWGAVSCTMQACDLMAKISFLARRAFKCLLCKSQTGPQQGWEWCCWEWSLIWMITGISIQRNCINDGHMMKMLF